MTRLLCCKLDFLQHGVNTNQIRALRSDEQEVDGVEKGGGGLSHAALKRQLTEAEREVYL